jgi:polyphosphate kinase 2
MDNYELNSNFSKIIETLKFLKLYTKKIEQQLIGISEYSKYQVVNFELLERGLRKILLKKGDKKKNVEEYFSKLNNSLKYRNVNVFESEPENDDYDFEIKEPSIVPKKVFKKELYELQVELIKLQEWLKKTGKTVVVLFEGRDSAGKGSTIKKFIENMNPKYYNVVALGVPSEYDRKNWWERYKREIKPGMINLFDRSWYNRGLIEPVMGYGTDEEYNDFMNNVGDFERNIIENDTYLFKLWFSIDKETQKRRFEFRQQSPLKYWKYSPNDSKMQDLWDRFTEFKEKLFDITSTSENPWVIIDAQDKRVSGLNAIRYVLKNVPYKKKDVKVVDVEYPEVITVLKP